MPTSENSGKDHKGPVFPLTLEMADGSPGHRDMTTDVSSEDPSANKLL